VSQDQKEDDEEEEKRKAAVGKIIARGLLA